MDLQNHLPRNLLRISDRLWICRRRTPLYKYLLILGWDHMAFIDTGANIDVVVAGNISWVE